jgi:hypothetical protein
MGLDCFHLGSRVNEDGNAEYYVFVYERNKQKPVTPGFEDIWDLREHLRINGTKKEHDKPWILSAITLLEENRKIPYWLAPVVGDDWIRPWNVEYKEAYERWKAEGGECDT